MELLKKLFIYFSIYFLYFIKKRIIFSNKKTIFYPYNFGLVIMFFCSRIYPKLNKFNKVFCYSKQQFETAKFFINEEYIEKTVVPFAKKT